MSQYKHRETEIREAISEARRFISRAEETLDAMDKDCFAEKGWQYHYHWNKQHAAMKRASLDLNNMLVKLRKPL